MLNPYGKYKKFFPHVDKAMRQTMLKWKLRQLLGQAKPVKNSKWNMRYRFFASHGITNAATQMEFQLDNKTLVLGATEKGLPLTKARDMSIIARNFESKASALEFGQHLGRSLKAAAVFAGIGVDIGKGNATFSVSKAIKDEIFKNTGLAFYDNVHGLLVYPEYPSARISQMKATGHVSMKPEQFISGIERAFSLNVTVSENLAIPIDLYCASCMENSHVAKLILALNAIEYIAEPSDRPKEELTLIDLACEAIDNASAGDGAKTQVKSLLKKQVSIGQACRNLIEKYLPDSLAEFKVLSAYRGRIAHPSSGEKRLELPDMAGKAQRLAGKLIERIIVCNE